MVKLNPLWFQISIPVPVGCMKRSYSSVWVHGKGAWRIAESPSSPYVGFHPVSSSFLEQSINYHIIPEVVHFRHFKLFSVLQPSSALSPYYSSLPKRISTGLSTFSVSCSHSSMSVFINSNSRIGVANIRQKSFLVNN